MKKQPEDVVDQLLADIDPPTLRNVINDNPELGAAIKYFLEQKAAGNEAAQHISAAWFYLNKLRDRFGGPASISTVRRYVHNILKLDWMTGKAL